MWWPQPKQAASATMAIVYITVGALMDVWTVIYFIYLRGQEPKADDSTFLWVYGFFFSGLVLVTIGFLVGYIGRSAKMAEVAAPPPPAAVAAPVAAPQQVAVAPQPGVVGAPAAPVTPANVATTMQR